jgi:hypothetical protein
VICGVSVRQTIAVGTTCDTRQNTPGRGTHLGNDFEDSSCHYAYKKHRNQSDQRGSRPTTGSFLDRIFLRLPKGLEDVRSLFDPFSDRPRGLGRSERQTCAHSGIGCPERENSAPKNKRYRTYESHPEHDDRPPCRGLRPQTETQPCHTQGYEHTSQECLSRAISLFERLLVNPGEYRKMLSRYCLVANRPANGTHPRSSRSIQSMACDRSPFSTR